MLERRLDLSSQLWSRHTELGKVMSFLPDATGTLKI